MLTLISLNKIPQMKSTKYGLQRQICILPRCKKILYLLFKLISQSKYKYDPISTTFIYHLYSNDYKTKWSELIKFCSENEGFKIPTNTQVENEFFYSIYTFDGCVKNDEILFVCFIYWKLKKLQKFVFLYLVIYHFITAQINTYICFVYLSVTS